MDLPNDSASHESFLISAANDTEADIIKSLLSSYGIPVVRKYREAGAIISVYMGGSRFGIDIFVPADQLEIARALLQNNTEAGDSVEISSVDEAEELKVEEQKYKKKRMIRTWIILSIFLLPTLFMILLWLINTVKWLLGNPQ